MHSIFNSNASELQAVRSYKHAYSYILSRKHRLKSGKCYIVKQCTYSYNDRVHVLYLIIIMNTNEAEILVAKATQPFVAININVLSFKSLMYLNVLLFKRSPLYKVQMIICLYNTYRRRKLFYLHICKQLNAYQVCVKIASFCVDMKK